MPKILVTGATGMLGREVCKEFKKKADFEVLGLGFSRAKDGILKVDLNDTDAVTKIISEFEPDAIIHCAAQRFPEKVDRNYEASCQLNVFCSGTLAKLAAKFKAAFLYISTDYVFDGENPPYKESDEPNPINKYGLTKYEGEKEVTRFNPDSCILRIPVLYGNEEYIGESAISSLIALIQVQHTDNTSTNISNWEIRFPSHVQDIACIIHDLIIYKLKDPSLSGIFHWCGKEKFTKYEMSLVLGQVLEIPCPKIVPLNSPPATCLRPKNTELSCERLESLGIGKHTVFKDGVRCYKTLLN